MSHRDRDDDRDVVDPDAPITEEEAAASAKLREELESHAGAVDPLGDVALARALQAAWSPTPIDGDEHAELVNELPGAEELARATALRDALAADPLVTALRAAYDPREIDEAEHRAIVARALGAASVKEESGRVVELAVVRRTRILRAVVAGTTTTLAIAASIVVWMQTEPSSRETPLAISRSTQPLFVEPFKPGEASARIDRIALARASDYRDNRFAKWGAR